MGIFTKKKLNDIIIYGIGQAINIVSPLVVIPYLILTCGEEGLGKIGVGFSVALILNSIIDYGSYINGVKEISINRNNDSFIIRKASSIYISKLILLVIISAVAVITFIYVPYFEAEAHLFFLSLTMVFGQVINPAWFFQATENFKIISFINILSKTIYVSCIFLFITQKDDYIFVNFFFGAGSIVANFIGLFILLKKYKYQYVIGDFEAAIKILKEEFNFCISQVMLSIYQYIPIVIISYLLGNYIAGHYKVIDQVLSLLKSYLNIFFYFIFSNVCYEISNSFKKGLKTWKLYNLANFVLISIIVSVLYVYSETILRYFKLDAEEIPTVAIWFRLGLLIPLLIAISLPLRQLMFAFDKNRIYINITIMSTIVNLMLLIYLSKTYGLMGAFISVIAIEIIIIFLYIHVINKHIRHND